MLGEWSRRRGVIVASRAYAPVAGLSRVIVISGHRAAPAGFAFPDPPPGCSADAPSAAASPAPAKAWPGAAGTARVPETGCCPASGARQGVLAVPADAGARLAAIRDQQAERKRDTAQEHRTTSSGRRRLCCVASDSPAGARRGLTGSCSGPISTDIAETAEGCGAMIPPRGTPVTRPRPSLRGPGRPARDVNQASSPIPSPLAVRPSLLIPSPRLHGSHPCSGGSRGEPVRNLSPAADERDHAGQTGQAEAVTARPGGLRARTPR